MKRLIAGGTGFIGKALIDRWLSAGHQLVVVGRDKNKIRKMYSDKVIAIDWSDVASMQEHILEDVSHIVNLTGTGIAEGRWTKKRKQEILQSRIESTEVFANLTAKLGKNSPALLNASAIGIYGLQLAKQNNLPPAYTEDEEIDFNKAPDFLSLVARQWEKATQVAKDAGVRVINMRFGVVLAKDGGALTKIAMPFRYYVGGKIGSGDQPFSWIHRDDLLSAIDFVISNPEVTGAVNMVSPNCISQKALANAIGHALDKPSFIPTPAFILEMIYGQLAHELLLAGQHVYPKKLLEHGFSFHYPEIDSALREIYHAGL